MSRYLVLVVGVAALALAPAAIAASPHYIRGPDATVSGNSLTVSWKAAGLGNTTESVDFNLAGTVNVTSQCFTKSGNPVERGAEVRADRRQRDRAVPGAKRPGDRLADGRAAVHARVHRQPAGCDPGRLV